MIFIQTLSWNGLDKLIKLKESLLPALEGLDYQWLIKDNGSTDNTVKIASTWGEKIKVIAYPNNLQNFSEGMNYCFNQAAPKDNDYILLLNNDVIFNDKKSIKNMVSIIENDNNVGVVGARLLYPNSNMLQHAGVIFHNQYKMPMHFRAKNISDVNAEKNREFQAVTGAVLLTKAEYYKKANTNNKSGLPGMQEEQKWAFCDIDFCLSIKYNLNKKVIYCGQTNIFHEESASLKKNPVNKLFLTHNVITLKNNWEYRWKLDQELYLRDSNYNLYK